MIGDTANIPHAVCGDKEMHQFCVGVFVLSDDHLSKACCIKHRGRAEGAFDYKLYNYVLKLLS